MFELREAAKKFFSKAYPTPLELNGNFFFSGFLLRASKKSYFVYVARPLSPPHSLSGRSTKKNIFCGFPYEYKKNDWLVLLLKYLQVWCLFRECIQLLGKIQGSLIDLLPLVQFTDLVNIYRMTSSTPSTSSRTRTNWSQRNIFLGNIWEQLYYKIVLTLNYR